MSKVFDLSALGARTERGQLMEFAESNQGEVTPISGAGGVLGPAQTAVAIALVGCTAISWVAHAFGSTRVAGFFLLVLLVLAIGLALVGVCSIPWKRRRAWRRRFRCAKFAESNHMSYTMEAVAPSEEYPGMLFHLCDKNVVIDRFRLISWHGVEIGNYRGLNYGQRSKMYSKRWGYVAVRLERRLPHIVLDSKVNRSFLASGMKTSFDRSQVLRLEGDFDRFFTLYCPGQYETDALYVLTPDLMALLIDHAWRLHVEIVDDVLYFYSTSAFDFEDSATWEELAQIVEIVVPKSIRRTDYYADSRIGDRKKNRVRRAGRRLKPSKALMIVGGVVLLAIAVDAIVSVIVKIVDAVF